MELQNTMTDAINMILNHILPNTPTEKLTMPLDVLGIVITALYLAGTMESLNICLKVGIGIVTLATVSFSLFIKIIKFREERQNQRNGKNS